MEPDITPDGKTVVYVGTDYAIFSVPIDGSAGPTKLTTKDPDFPCTFNHNPTVSPDGNTVYFEHLVFDEESCQTSPPLINDVYSVPIQGGDITQVTYDNAYHYGLEITPDGENFVYSDSGGLVTQPVSGGSPTRLIGNGTVRSEWTYPNVPPMAQQ